MTKEDKKLLLKDLSGRLPYGVQVFIDGDNEPYALLSIHPNKDIATIGLNMDGVYATRKVNIGTIKPYLRSTSNITKDEIYDLANTAFQGLPCDIDVSTGSFRICHYDEYGEVYEDYTVDDVLRYYCNVKALDWFYAHHFDVHNLIKRGLAVEAPKDMYEDLNYTYFTLRFNNE